ncbi:unnamed protein product [Citrullus colocynthis]|uniref:Uncharacterized protein n=1 Tax=Citrullus colocynthis TaxID=252529 RepID=A0ABP0YIS4_9ROSI
MEDEFRRGWKFDREMYIKTDTKSALRFGMDARDATLHFPSRNLSRFKPERRTKPVKSPTSCHLATVAPVAPSFVDVCAQVLMVYLEYPLNFGLIFYIHGDSIQIQGANEQLSSKMICIDWNLGLELRSDLGSSYTVVVLIPYGI